MPSSTPHARPTPPAPASAPIARRVPPGSRGYLVALGSNRPGRHGRPADEVRAALAAIGAAAASPVVGSAPLGPSIRRFANAAAWLDTDERPPALLARLKAAERASGRRRGRRWGVRVLDLDIVLWSGGRWPMSAGRGRGCARTARALAIPHPLWRERAFVLGPLAALAPGWRDPDTGASVRQLLARLTRPRPLPRA